MLIGSEGQLANTMHIVAWVSTPVAPGMFLFNNIDKHACK